MGELLDRLLTWMLALPDWVVRLVLGAAAALENVVPPIPADVVVLFGGFLTAQSGASVWLVFLATWLGNVAGALFVYALGRRFGKRVFATRWGSLLLQPAQLDRLDAFYRRRGVPVLFVSRFLPVFRALVPVFAGMSGLGWFRAALPIAAASALWYGLLVYLGATAGRNWSGIRSAVESGGRWLALAALVAALVALRWWWRTRRVARA